MKDPLSVGHHHLRDSYSAVVFSISNDLIFWKTFLPSAIQTYREKYPNQFRLFESGLYAYNIQLDNNAGWLHSFNKSVEINDDNLDQSRDRFFQWIQLLSIVRIYNALELVLYSIIEIRYPPAIGEFHARKKLKTAILADLKKEQVAHETKNNQFLLAYLRHRNAKLSQFFSLPVTNLTTSRSEFFEFLSLIRHIIVHNGMLLSRDNHNLLKERFSELMERYFMIEQTTCHESKIVFDETKGGMQNLISVCDDLAYNAIKFAFDLGTINS